MRCDAIGNFPHAYCVLRAFAGPFFSWQPQATPVPAPYICRFSLGGQRSTYRKAQGNDLTWYTCTCTWYECADQGSHHQGSHRGLLTIDQAGPGTGPVPPQAITVAINRQTRSTTLLKQGINTTRPFVDLSICGRKRPPSTHQTNRRPGSTGLSTTLFTAAINWAGSDLAVYRSTGWIKVG